jgi:membrane associated rhomboid family serine protease
MNSFRDDLTHSFIPRYGAVARIIVATVGVYLLLGVVGVGLYLAGQEGYFATTLEWLTFSTQPLEFLTKPWTLLTYGFIHAYPIYPHGIGALFHLVFNMLWLYWIGRIYREYIGDRAVWGTYLLGIVAGALLSLAVYNLSPRLGHAHILGGSAGVMAIVVATATLLPTYRIGLLLIGPIQLKWLAFFYVAMDFIMIMGSAAGTSAVIAHLGGALLGFTYVALRKQGRDMASPFVSLYTGFVGLFRRRKPRAAMRVVKPVRTAPVAKRVEVRGNGHTPTPSYTPAPEAPARAETDEETGKPTQEEIDRILERIQQVGYDRLTKAEKQALYRFSQD